MSHDRIFTRRNTKPEAGSRQSGLGEPEPKAKRRSALIKQGLEDCKRLFKFAHARAARPQAKPAIQIEMALHKLVTS